MTEDTQTLDVADPRPVDDRSTATRLRARPRLADRVRLRGALKDGGFQDGAWLVERDGRFVQLSELLYRLTEQCDGSRDLAQIAAALTEHSRWQVGAQQVDHLLTKKLVPLGLVRIDEPGGKREDQHTGARIPTTSPPAGDVLQSPLRLAARRRLLGPQAIEVVSRPLRFLFVPAVAAAVLLAVFATRVWLYVMHGPGASIQQVFHDPVLFLLVVGTVLVAGVFHEFGHSSALRYGGGRARGMGVGFYTIFPAFYTDVTDGYRLSRWRRVRTDVGGPYFHLVFSLLVLAAYLATRQEFLLLVVVLIDLEAMRQLLPLKRLDGYWLLADLLGLPDLTTLIPPLLRSLPRIGRRMGGERLPPLRRSVRLVFIGYAVSIAVALPAALLVMIYFIPHLTAQAWANLVAEAHQLPAAVHGRDVVSNRVVDVTAVLLGLALLGIQMLGLWIFVVVLVVRPAMRAFRWSRHRPRPVRRLVRLGVTGPIGAGAMAYGAVWPWAHLSGGVGRPDMSGLLLVSGKALLAGGLACAALIPMTLLAGSRRWRIACGTAALVVGLGGVIAGAWGLAHPGDLLDRRVAARMEAQSGHEPAPAQVRQVVRRLDRLGVTATPAYGAAVETAGAVLTVAVASVALAATRRRSLAADQRAYAEQVDPVPSGGTA